MVWNVKKKKTAGERLSAECIAKSYLLIIKPAETLRAQAETQLSVEALHAVLTYSTIAKSFAPICLHGFTAFHFTAKLLMRNEPTVNEAGTWLSQ